MSLYAILLWTDQQQLSVLQVLLFSGSFVFIKFRPYLQFFLHFLYYFMYENIMNRFINLNVNYFVSTIDRVNVTCRRLFQGQTHVIITYSRKHILRKFAITYICHCWWWHVQHISAFVYFCLTQHCQISIYHLQIQDIITYFHFFFINRLYRKFPGWYY